MKKHILATVLLILLSSLFMLSTKAQVLDFNEDFSTYAIGASARSLKQTVRNPSGRQDKWLLLQNNATHKLSKNIVYPKNFTLDFDLLAQAGHIKTKRSRILCLSLTVSGKYRIV
jgi:hypothetical protein